MPSSSDERPRRSSHLSRQPEVSDAWEGRGHRGREPAGQTRGRYASRRCSWATRLANLLPPPRAARRNAQPSEPAPARPPSRSWGRGPGTRTPERKEGAPAAAPHLPRSARPRRPLAPRPPPPRPPEQSANTALGQIQRSRALGGGGPAQRAE